MKNLHVYGKKPQPIGEISRQIIILNRGMATVTLHRDGMITISSVNVPEGAVKRDGRYKTAVYEMSEQMVQSYEAQTNAFTQLHHRLKKNILLKKSYEGRLDKIVKETYKRRTFNLPEPNRDEVKHDLQVEADAVYHNLPNKEAKVQSFIKERLTAQLQDRKAKWLEAKKLFDEIEQAREQKANESFQRKYEAEYKEELSFINGDPAKVEPEIDAALRELDNPFGFDFQYSYTPVNGTIQADVELSNGVELPLQKGEMLASGKISVKNKLMREIAQQTTETIFSFVFYLAWKLFGTSPNIEHVQIKILERGKQNGFLWVDFSRTEFARNISSSIDPITEILAYPNVFDLRTRNQAEELVPIAAAKFQNWINEAYGYSE